MKKILGISLVALLAVSPMMANAAQTAASIAEATATAGGADNDAIATAAYVKGAYNAARAGINAIVTDIDVTSDGTNVKAANSVAENLQALDTRVEAVATAAGNTYQLKSDSNVETAGNYISTGNGVASNLGALDSAIGKLTVDGTYIKDATEKNISENLSALDTQLATVSDTVSNYSTDLDAKQDKSDSTVAANGNYIVAGTAVATNLGNLDSAVGKLTADGNYIKDAGEKNISENLSILDTQLKSVADTAAAANAANTIVVYSGWNNGAAPKSAAAYSTMTADAAAAIIATANATSGGTGGTSGDQVNGGEPSGGNGGEQTQP